MGVLAPPVFKLFFVARGELLTGVVVFILWAAVWYWMVIACDRKAIVRRHVSVVATLVVLILFALRFWRLL